MRPFQYLEQTDLLDLLAHVTTRYTRIFSLGTTNTDIDSCRQLLHLLQDEIMVRRKLQKYEGHSNNDNRDQLMK